MRVNIKHLVFGVCIAFVFLAFADVVSARTIYVPDNYAKIQWAVDNASAGDTIIVRDGTYYESVVVNKKLTIKSENGSDNCIVDGTGSTVFTLEADGIRIEGFTITGSWDGIYLKYSNNNIISRNSIIENGGYGIHLYNSNNNSISENNIIENDGGGIFLRDSNKNIISGNSIMENNEDGIEFSSSSNNIILRNSIRNNWRGIYLNHIYHSSNNILYLNNIINNTYQVTSVGENIWNSTEKITYTYNGKQYTNYLGNYWSDYKGSDEDGDGIGDTPYSIGGGGDKDNYPLMERFENYLIEGKLHISITTDKTEYTTGDIMLTNITIANPSKETKHVIFNWWVTVPSKRFYTAPLATVPMTLPPAYNITFTYPITVGYWGADSFGAVFCVALTNQTSGKIISFDATFWNYEARGAREAGEKSIESIVSEIKRSLHH